MSSTRNRKILSACLVASLCLHLGVLGFWHRYAIWFGPVQKICDAIDWIGLTGKQQRDEILKTAFENIVEDAVPAARFAPQPEEEIAFQKPLSIPEHPLQPPIFQMPVWPEQELAVSFFPPPGFALPSDSFNLLDHLPKDLILPPAPKTLPPPCLPLSTCPKIVLTSPTHPIGDAPNKEEIKYEDLQELAAIEKPELGTVPSRIDLPDLPKLFTLEDLDTQSCSDAFDTELVFLPKEEGEGYIFALTLIPRENLQLPRIRQNVTFLIDRSNSIQQGRLSATKAAVHKALEELGAEDTFNIIAFDSKMEKMSPSAVACNPRSLAMAETFLEKIQLGSFFTGADLYRPLFLTVPGKVEPDETYTAILLTDGESLARKNAQGSLISDWTQYNQGKVSLYIVSMNDANAPILETAAAFNKGKLIQASANRGLKRKLLKLMKTIQTPIAKSISCKAISLLPQSKVKILSKSTQMPNLYLDQPYAILGEAETLDDFILFVQGRLRGRWINIRKTVSFLNAKKGNKALKQEWALQKALHFYERYLIEQDAKYIAEAKELLEPLDLPVVLH